MIEIRELQLEDVESVVELGSRAWTPVHPSIEECFTSEIYRALVVDPDGEQRAAITAVCTTSLMEVWVALVNAEVAGFVAIDFAGAPTMAEIHMIAVDPSSQRQGVANALMTHAEQIAVARGIQVLMVETGGDPGHHSARSLYTSTGYHRVPVERYFKNIG
jgi:ribosomal protein S18 acetylase RimI-like enzyme